VYTENARAIEKHNLLYRAKKVSHFQAVNKFADYTNEEFVATFTGVPTDPESHDHDHHHHHHRSKRAAATWTVPATFVANENINLTTPAIPV
jgi:hypothetical protein